MSTNEEIKSKMTELLSVILGVDADTITDETAFEADLGAKSSNITMMLTQLEDEYDVEIPFLRVKKAKTVGATVSLIAEMLDE